MEPASYSTFYAASAGSGGALIGLLFVSVSLSPESTIHADAPWERRAAASSAFTALVNAFFVSLGALLPQSNPGIVVLVMSAASALTTAGLGINLLRQRMSWPAAARRGLLLLVGLGVYGFEFANGMTLLKNADDAAALQSIAIVVMGIYALGLLRAWELLGAQRYTFFGALTGLHRGSRLHATAPPDAGQSPGTGKT